ncbi:MAG: hypothetical protein KGI60_03605 [Patescibacteria group bacterium]|nr:hypothetical protein [Patescibacteria group bacterium]
MKQGTQNPANQNPGVPITTGTGVSATPTCPTPNYKPDAQGKCNAGDSIVQCNGSSVCYQSPSSPINTTSAATNQGVRAYHMAIPIPCQAFPGSSCPSLDTNPTLASYIIRLYQFGLMIVGLFAFASIIYGALKYILSAGSMADQGDAKDQITQAIVGLLLLLGAFVLLYTINPNLVNIQNPALEPLNLSALPSAGMPTGAGTPQVAGSGSGSGDPLCKLAVNASIGIGISANTQYGSQQAAQTTLGSTTQNAISGAINALSGQHTGSTCISCVANAQKVNGVCQCDTGYQQNAGNQCVKP